MAGFPLYFGSFPPVRQGTGRTYLDGLLYLKKVNEVLALSGGSLTFFCKTGVLSLLALSALCCAQALGPVRGQYRGWQ